MTNKEKLDFILNNAIFPDNVDKELRKEVYKKIDEIEKDLGRLEQIDKSNPSEALEILETFNGGLLNKEIGAISYNKIWLENQIKALKQALLKAQQQDKILEILKPYFRGAVFPSAINFNFSEEDWKPIKEWLDNGNKYNI